MEKTIVLLDSYIVRLSAYVVDYDFVESVELYRYQEMYGVQ